MPHSPSIRKEAEVSSVSSHRIASYDVVLRNISSLIPHPDNPRIHSKKQVRQIASSIDTFGFQFPVLVDELNHIIAGHGRVMAAEQLGITEVPTLCATGLNAEKIRALMIADNKLTENAKWDKELLGKNFQFLCDMELDFDIETTGFDYGEIEPLVMQIEESVVDTDPLDDVGAINPLNDETVCVSQLGDVWVLGNHAVFCGDALNKDSYKKILGRKKADIVITDPPYNLSARDIGKVAEKHHGNFQQAGGEMSEEEFKCFLEQLFSQLCFYSKAGSIHYVFMDWRHLDEILSAGHEHYSELKNLCVWAKDRAGMGTFYRSQHELVLVFKNGMGKHQNHFQLGQYGRCRSNLWQYPSIRSSAASSGGASSSGGHNPLLLHPTMKPVAMLQDALIDCSKRGQIVLDPFLGSGSTLLAAELCNRKCIGIEIEPRYLDITICRWQQLTGQEAIHADTGETFLKRQQLAD